MNSHVRHESLGDFKFKARVVSSDRCAAQLVAERGLAALRPGFVSLHVGCEIHMRTLPIRAVSEMIRVALPLRLGGRMKVFRRCLLDEIASTIDIQEGRSSVAAKEYRRAAVTAFMGTGVRSRAIQTLLSILPNGDWERHDIVQVFVHPGKFWDKGVVARMLKRALCLSLCGASFDVFNRKRWTENDHCVSQLGLMQACHGLPQVARARGLQRAQEDDAETWSRSDSFSASG